MKERPIRFSGEMVRALLDSRKTQTRRVVNPQPQYRDIDGLFASWVFFDKTLCPNGKEKVLERCSYGQPGDQRGEAGTGNPCRSGEPKGIPAQANYAMFLHG